MRLIDADKFAELMKKLSEDSIFKDDCRKAYKAVYLMLTVEKNKYSPTAYDVDAVVAELEETRKCDADNGGFCNHCTYTWCPLELVPTDDAIEIVKGGAE